MRTTNIAELKNHLSSFLADVKRGEEILISDRNQPIAKIVPLHNTSDFSAEELALAAAGILRLPEIRAEARPRSQAPDIRRGDRCPRRSPESSTPARRIAIAVRFICRRPIAAWRAPKMSKT